MLSHLFNRNEVQIYHLIEGPTKPGDFGHTWGGEAVHAGTIPSGCKKPVHLFFNLDLADPRLGVTFPNPAVTHLPLYYALGNLGGSFGYRVVSNTKIELFSQPYPAKWRAGIMKDFPEPFGLLPVELAAAGYDPTDPSDVFFAGGLLGIAALTPRQKTKLKKDFLRFNLEEFGVDLIEEDYDGNKSTTIDEMVTGYTPFIQGMPNGFCPNPKCANHKSEKRLPVLAYLQPEEEDDFYKRIAGGDSGQLIWQFCEKCGSVAATNPCT